MEAYCVKCRTKVEIQNPKDDTMRNGRPTIKGKCPSCGTGVSRLGRS